MKLFQTSLKARLALALSLLILVICAGLVALFDRQAGQLQLAAAQNRQSASLRVLVDEFARRYEELRFGIDADGRVTDIRWDALPDLETHELIDSVGRISGETATLFGWDPAQGDFIRLSTNIVKPDGTRAVGTWLGKDNPVHAAMLRNETFRGEADILGKSYFTVYQPILGPDGAPVGIFYVGVDRSLVDARIVSQSLQGAGFAAVAVLVGLVALLFLLSRFMQPLRDITLRLEAMAEGDLAEPVPGTERADELGRTARAVEGFRSRLEQSHAQDAELEMRRVQQERVIGALREGLERLAQRDLSARLPEDRNDSMGDYAAIREDFNAGIESLAHAMLGVSQVTHSVRNAATEIGTTSDDLARRVEEQAATLEKSAAALDALAGTGTEIAANAEKADSLAGTSRKLSSESEQVLAEAIAAIGRIEEASSKINQIITAIDDIAFQTNLLALNAGVEAARAGEAGRGFAVVASEVRSLAQTAAEAAQEIKTLIRDSNDEVREGANLVQRTGTSLGQVLTHVDRLGTLISDIAGAVRSQSNGLSEINSGVQQLESMTQHNAAVVEELNAAGQSLNAEAHRLSDTVEVFGVSEGAVSAPVQTESLSETWEAPETAPPAPQRKATGTDDSGWDDF